MAQKKTANNKGIMRFPPCLHRQKLVYIAYA